MKLKTFASAGAIALALGLASPAAAWTSHSWGGGKTISNEIVAESDAGNATTGQGAAVGDDTTTATISGGVAAQYTAVVTDEDGDAEGIAAAGEASGSAAIAAAADDENASTAASTDAAGGSAAKVTETNIRRNWRYRNMS